MGAIRPELKSPRVIRRKDGDKVDLYAEGGVTTKADEPVQMYAKGGQSKVNEAGNYTKPGMRKSLFNSIKSQATQGTAAGQWSARKAQLLAKQYKAKGGGYK